MPDDALESVLRLVSEGRLTADEAGPILDALAERPTTHAADSGPSAAPATSPGGGPGRAIRLEVIDGGRKVVNLRVPLALGRAALGRVPGLTEATTDRIREAMDAGITGPILDVDEGTGEGVRIVIE
jgi:hypothetical protein